MNDPHSAPEKPTFEASLGALERMVREMEDGQLGLDDALARYEEGVALLRACYSQLREAEQRILQLTGVEAGQPVLQPFQHEATAIARAESLKSPLSRSRRKAAGESGP